MSALSDIKREAQPSVLYLIKHELLVFWIASKTIHFIPILSLCLRKNFEYRFCISRENRGKSFVKIYVCFITYKDSFTAMIFFVFCSWIINEFLKDVSNIYFAKGFPIFEYKYQCAQQAILKAYIKSLNGHWYLYFRLVYMFQLPLFQYLILWSFCYTRDTLKILYNTLILPYFDYCCLVWNNCWITLKTNLQKLQNEAARIITGDTYDIWSKQILEERREDKLKKYE